MGLLEEAGRIGCLGDEGAKCVCRKVREVGEFLTREEKCGVWEVEKRITVTESYCHNGGRYCMW